MIDRILEKEDLLRQYSLWLRTSEKETRYRGMDVYFMLVGFLQAFYGTDAMPGIDHKNFVEVAGTLQAKTGLDLGVCTHLVMPETADQNMYTCGISGHTITGLSQCIAPGRTGCVYR